MAPTAFLLLALGGALLVARGFVKGNPTVMARALAWTATLAASILATYLVLTGREVALAFLAAPVIPWLLHLHRRGRSQAQSTPGGTSTVESDWLSMRLDLATGDMAGVVRRGAFAGRSLDALSLEERVDLYLILETTDATSARLLETFLDRRHGGGWRYVAAGRKARSTSAGGDAGRSAEPRSGMSRAEALSILGLAEGASSDDIAAAHRRLILANHPDRGGSSYLAAKINEARAALLG